MFLNLHLSVLIEQNEFVFVLYKCTTKINFIL